MAERITNKEAVVEELYQLLHGLNEYAAANGGSRALPFFNATNLILMRVAELSGDSFLTVIDNLKQMDDPVSGESEEKTR